MNISRAYISNTNQEEVLKVTKSFKKDQAVYQQGDNAVKYYKVISGIVVIGSYTAEGKMVYKSLVHENGFFGDEVVSGLEERVNFALAFSKDLVIEEYKQDSFWINQFHQKEVTSLAKSQALPLLGHPILLGPCYGQQQKETLQAQEREPHSRG